MQTKNQLFINKKIWSKFTKMEMDQYVEKVFTYYKENGFPYFKLTDNQIDDVFNKMIDFDSSTLLLKDNILKQVMLGLNLVNYYMPHMWEIKSNNFKSPMDCFNNDEMLLKAIKKRIAMGDNMSDAGMRKALSWTHGHHRVSNFRPTIAKYIYDNYSGDGNVFDFSSGFGGRLLGALTSNKVKKYTGTDPSDITYEFLLNMVNELPNNSTSVTILNEPVEDLSFNQGVFDLCFSSPPYFNTEEYAYDNKQSFVRYNTVFKWKWGFLLPMLKYCYKWLKPDGYMAINVANVSTYTTFETDILKYAKLIGFKHIKTYKMALSSLMKGGFKYEPIFILNKKKNERRINFY